MSVITSGIITAGVLFIFSIASGYWLNHLGKPFNIVVVTIHKLISLATVIFSGLAFYNLSRSRVSEISSFDWGAIVISGLFFIILFITGALISTGKPVTIVISLIHKVTPLLSVLSTAVVIFRLASGR